MGIRRAVWLALSLPLFAILLLMSPMLLSGGAQPWKLADLSPLLELSLGFGLPQYLVFASLFALATHGRPDSRIRRLALLAPLLFVPFLIAPMAFHSRSAGDVMHLALVMGGLSIAVGYPCVFVGLALWKAGTARISNVES